MYAAGIRYLYPCGKLFFPIVQELKNATEQVNSVFCFENFRPGVVLLSDTEDPNQGIIVSCANRERADEKTKRYVQNAKIVCYICNMSEPTKPQPFELSIDKDFYIRFFNDHYFVDGILNKNFAYGTYPTEEERHHIVSQFKADILSKLK